MTLPDETPKATRALATSKYASLKKQLKGPHRVTRNPCESNAFNDLWASPPGLSAPHPETPMPERKGKHTLKPNKTQE